MHIQQLHRTLLDEHFRIKGRMTWYELVEQQMQTDQDNYLMHATPNDHIRTE